MATDKCRALRSYRDQVLLVRYHRDRDRGRRDEVIARFLPLARSVARRYLPPGQSIEDLEQVAAMGLVKAGDRFDPGRGVTFSSFAVPAISGEIKRYLRDRSWAVRPPRDLLERALRVQGAIEQLTANDQDDILEALLARQAATAASLEPSVGNPDPGQLSLAERLGSHEDGYEHVEDRYVLDGLLSALSARERLVLHMRFARDMTQVEIGAVLGVSQMQISRILRGALERLRIAAAHQRQSAA